MPEFRVYITARDAKALSDAGEVPETLLPQLVKRHLAERREEQEKAKRFAREIQESETFRDWRLSGTLEEYGFLRLLHALPSSPAEFKRDNLAQLLGYVKEYGTVEAAKFLEAGGKRFVPEK